MLRSVVQFFQHLIITQKARWSMVHSHACTSAIKPKRNRGESAAESKSFSPAAHCDSV